MKLASRLCLVVILFFSFDPMKVLAASSGESGLGDYELNLIGNGTFDAISEQPGSIVAWDTWYSEDETEVADSPVQPDNPVLKIHTEDIPVKWGVSEAHQWVDLVPEQRFSFTADVFFESAENALVTMRIDFFDETLDKSNPNLAEAYITHLYKDLYNEGSGFEPIEITGTVPEGTRYAKVEFDIKAHEANAKGTAYFDNARLVYQWAPTHLRTTGRTETSISMEWDEPLYGDRYVYEVYGLTAAGDDVLLKETVNTSFTLSDLPPPTSPAEAVMAYSFYVKAKPELEPSLISWPSNTLRAATKKPANTITIMPLGDSLTQGYTEGMPMPGGYRGTLWELLQSRHSNSLFVGSLKVNPADIANFDPDHEGHPGYTVQRFAKLVDSQITAYTPDYVILMAGTNDMWDRNNEAAFYMRETLDEILERLPDTYVIVASIPNIYLNNQTLRETIVQYNDALEGMVGELRGAGKKVGFVDMNAMLKESYFSYPGSDHFHPDADGYSVMADVWYDAIDAAIVTGDVSGRFPTKPVLYEPVLSAEHSAVELSWQEANDNIGVDHYKIYLNDVEKASVTGATYGVVTNLAPSAVYDFSVAAVDKAGNETVSDKVRVETPAAPDLNPPAPPSELSSTGISHNSVTLSWVPGTDDVGIREYQIGYDDSAVSVTDIVYGSDKRITYKITGLSPETRYDFNVRAIDHSGNASEASNPLSVETMAAPPSDLRVEAKTTTSVTLSWTAATDKDGITEYRIYRNDSPTVVTGQTSYTIEGLTPGQTYSFQITAVDTNNNETLPTDALAVRMEFQAPLGLAVTEKTVHTIDIRWSPVGGASGYHVYIDGNRVATTTDTVYHAKDLTPDTKYSFAVQSIFGKGLESEIGAAIEVSTEKIPDLPVTPPVSLPQGGGGGGGGAPLVDTEPKYETTDKGIKLSFVPNEEKALKSLEGADARLALDIPSEKPFDWLELELSGTILKLAADKRKPIAIRMGGLALEIPPGWLNIKEKDQIRLTIAKRSLDEDHASLRQSLRPISVSYDFKVQRNGEKVTEFAKPTRLSISTLEKPDADLTGVYLWDDTKGEWTYFGGEVDVDGNVMLEQSHFSEYAVFTGMKTFDDISDHWARKEIESLAAKQIVMGLTSDRFDPSGEITRAEFAVTLARAFKLKASNEQQLPFDDLMEDSWYYDSVAAAYHAGWIKGVGGSLFAPAALITREEMAVMIEKAYEYAKGGNAGQNDPINDLPFRDSAEISEWAVNYVHLATARGLIQGISGSFMPDLYANRAQAAVMISRLLQLTD